MQFGEIGDCLLKKNFKNNPLEKLDFKRKIKIESMGTWGASLYDDDDAADIRDTVRTVCKVPASGDDLLKYLREIYDECKYDDNEDLFWLVTADQFERLGIECHEVATRALAIIENGSDLKRASECDADASFLKKRAITLEKLALRLKAPRQFRPRSRPKKLPPLVLSEGEIYVYPTMREVAWHPYRLSLYGPFVPDAWGALIVLRTGRAFEWSPWVAISKLAINSDIKPSLEEALQARLTYDKYDGGASRYIPKASHAKGMGLELLGKVELDENLVTPHITKWSVAKSIRYGWSIAYGAMNPTPLCKTVACEVASLLKASA